MSTSPKVNQYQYDLPPELISNTPAEPRDAARLFVFDTKTGEIHFDVFANVGKYLPAPATLVCNNTKVLPARATLSKQTGGKVEVLFLMNELRPDDETVWGMVDRKVTVGDILTLGDESQEQSTSAAAFQAVDQRANLFEFKPLFPIANLVSLLFQYGITPLPKYIEQPTMEEQMLRARYQSVFSETPASVAAPTASLHFTERVFDDLTQRGIEKTFVTLHVGLGTFAPVTEETIQKGTLHKEFFEISAQAAEKISESKKNGKPIIAVGTTTIRTLESSIEQIQKGFGASGFTEIFIKPPYQFQMVDALITNFHLPGSSLMYLVDAFLQFKQAQKSSAGEAKGILDLYKVAVAEKFKFYSFGDAMLIV